MHLGNFYFVLPTKELLIVYILIKEKYLLILQRGVSPRYYHRPNAHEGMDIFKNLLE